MPRVLDPESDGDGVPAQRAEVLPASASSEAGESDPSDHLRMVPAVGIGASAGGLEACSELLRHLPADSGLAYLLVQHLDPTHESSLAELLSRIASIPVVQAVDGMHVEADHAYVIPPNARMTLADEHIVLSARVKEPLPPSPVDELFRSIAAVRGSSAVGIVLSGTGADGAAGIEAIKAAGGLTFVQEPKTAAHDGMPRAAVATGSVDFVLPPAQIGEHLARIGKQPFLHLDRLESQEQVTEPFLHILGLLRRRSGFDFTLYKRETITRRLLRRMLLAKVDALEDYLILLRSDTVELDSLHHDLLIGVTRFFRDDEVFALLCGTVLPGMMRSRTPGSGLPVRAWVTGCGTGEEAYSVAMCLMESLPDDLSAETIEIFATDVSDAALRVARAGLYPRSIEHDVSRERLRRFFVREAGGYRVTKALRERCVFARHNVISDPPFTQLDLVSCRNLLIYLQPVLHTKLLTAFHYALKPGGILLLGTAESVNAAPDLFEAVDERHRVYASRGGANRWPGLDEAERHPARNLPRALVPHVAPRQPGLVEIQKEADQIVLDSFAPASVLIDDQFQILQFRGRSGPYLEPVSGVASLNLLKMVRRELRGELRSAVRKAARGITAVVSETIALHDGELLRHVTVTVVPFKLIASDVRFFVAMFADAVRGHTSPPGNGAPAGAATGRRSRVSDRTIRELQQQLDATERHLRVITDEHTSATEELRAAYEEIQSSNEELQSTNEELETAKEELQATNQELTVINDEIRARGSELAAANDDLMNLLASIATPVLMLDRELRIRRATSGIGRLLHVMPADIGRPVGHLQLPEGARDLEQVARAALETFTVTEREICDNNGRWYAMVVRPYRSAQNRVDGVVIVFRDIETQKQAAGLVEQAREYLLAIVEALTTPLLVLDAQLHVRTANEAFYHAFRSTSASVEGREFFELDEGGWDVPTVRSQLKGLEVRDDWTQRLELEHDFPAIGRRTVVMCARRLDVGEDAPFTLIAFEDATVRRRIERYQQVLARVSDMVTTTLDRDDVVHGIAQLVVPEIADWCIIDVREDDGQWRRAVVLHRDPAMAELARRVASDAFALPANPVFEVLRTGKSFLAEEASPELQAVLAPATPGAALPAMLAPRSLKIVPLATRGRILGAITLISVGRGTRMNAMLLPGAEELGRRAAFALERLEIYRDMSSALDAARRANDAKSQFLANMSHELRTPLNAILGYGQLLEMELHGPLTPAQQHDLQRIENSRRHLTDLIEDILSFAKLEAGSTAFQFSDLPVDQVLASSLEMVATQFRRTHIECEHRHCDAPCRVHADAVRLQQVIVNLLTNASKFTPPGGRVTLECAPGPSVVEIRVIDTGIGIPADKLDAVFEPFVQLDNALTRLGKGTGLGLTISRDLARAMGGDLVVSSMEGKGSTFTLTLPRGSDEF